MEDNVKMRRFVSKNRTGAQSWVYRSYVLCNELSFLPRWRLEISQPNLLDSAPARIQDLSNKCALLSFSSYFLVLNVFFFSDIWILLSAQENIKTQKFQILE